MNYDCFISYQREGGIETARLIKVMLESRGIRVFVDVGLRTADFDERLLTPIAQSPNFIVLLTPGFFEHCLDEANRGRREIAHALKTRRNIIPVLKDGFQFPDLNTLPPDISELTQYNGVPFNHQFFDAFIQILVDRLVSLEAMNEKTAGLSSSVEVDGKKDPLDREAREGEVFLSYSREDKTFAHDIAEILNQIPPVKPEV